MEIYLDNSATTKVCPEAANEALRVMTEIYGNPSAVHSFGIKAKQVVERSRKNLADALGADVSEVYFSHSGTLANNTAIFGAVNARRKLGNRIVTTRLEHPSVMRCMDELEQQGFQVVRLAPGKNGAFELSDLLDAVNKNTILVSTMLVNNEIGCINPVEYISRAVKKASAPALIHIDAIQGFGKIPVKPGKMGIDLLTVSGHKIHAPKGVGALYVRKNLAIKPYIFGGGQENNLFSGTEPLPAVAGFGAACECLSLSSSYDRVMKLRDYTVSMLKSIPQVKINSPADALPYILNISLMGVPSQVLINYLSERGIFVSAGSACKKGHRSEVLSVMGLPPAVIDSAVRVSFSRYTTVEEAEIFVSALNDAAKSIRTKI